ncbi:hypothetical protein ABZW02_20250 [Streptomyces sp. NPDC005180]|uniref:hypothetical protein n=1 Tax=Streptomyces sp. NPDC005180 TaxID=3156868 RepID=UPI0033B52609
MPTPSLPRRKPGASGRQSTVPEHLPGAPSRALRIRAADGWERFQQRAGDQDDRTEDGAA